MAARQTDRQTERRETERRETAPRKTARAAPEAKTPPVKAPLADPPRRARGPLAVGALALRAAAPALGKRGFAAAEILAHWPAIVGDDLAAFACPIELKFPRGRGAGAVLHLRIAGGAAATLIHLKTPTILARVNGFLGYAAVASVQATQGPLPRAARAKVPPVDTAAPPATLDAALAKLGAAVERRARARR